MEMRRTLEPTTKAVAPICRVSDLCSAPRAVKRKSSKEMKRSIFSLGWTLFLFLPVSAQDTPKVEIFGGFSYADIVTTENQFSARGWHAMIVVNSRQRWFEFVGDFSGHYGSLDGAPTNTHTVMAGIRFSFQHARLLSFAHSLYGLSFGRPPLTANDDFGKNQNVWFTFVPAGGGMDIILHRRLAVRLVQVDLLVHSDTPSYLQGYPQLSRRDPYNCGYLPELFFESEGFESWSV